MSRSPTTSVTVNLVVNVACRSNWANIKIHRCRESLLLKLLLYSSTAPNFTSLLFQTSSASIEKGSLVPKFVERERGFTNLVLLHDAAIDILDQDNSQPSAPKIWSIFRSHVHHSRIHFITSHLSHLQLAYRPVRYNP